MDGICGRVLVNVHTVTAMQLTTHPTRPDYRRTRVLPAFMLRHTIASHIQSWQAARGDRYRKLFCVSSTFQFVVAAESQQVYI
jgi:hypothetical protein